MVTQYLARSAWTSSGRGGAQLTGTKLFGIAWHWPGTSQNVIGAESKAATANRLRGYRNFHMNTRGWSDIGYGHGIDQAGRVWDLRGLGRVGAHSASSSNPDANHEWHGVLLILGDQERPSAAMIRACQDFTHDVFLKRWPGRTRMTGHGRAPGVPGAQTSCPGPFVAKLITDGTLADQPTNDVQEDDMPYKDWPQADREALLKDFRQEMTRGWTHAAAVESRDILRAMAPRVRSILSQVGNAEDAAAIAAELAPLVIPPIVAALSGEDGATPEQVEERVAAALKDFFAPLSA